MLSREHPGREGASRERRFGTTLTELLVVLVLLVMVGGAIIRVAVGQQRFLGAVEQVMRMERTVREGVDIPRGELRAVVPGTGGIYQMAPNRVEFRAPVGSSVICAVDSTRTTIAIPARLSWSALSSWIASPRVGDTLLVFDAAIDSTPPGWRIHTLATELSPGGRCDVTTGLARTSSEESAALTFRLTTPLEPATGAGSAVRFVRRSRYELYRAGDSRWYLGFLDCAPARAVPCGTIQPVSGPFETDGVRFSYSDSAGATATDPTRVARIDVLSRAATTTPLRAIGFALGFHSDSVLASIALRNR